MRIRLEVVGGEVNAAEFEAFLPAVIGRAKAVDLCIAQPLVSRRHCQLYRKAGQVFVRDLGSLNGTFVNNQKIDGEHPVLPDQLLTFGTVTLRVHYQPMDAGTAEIEEPPVPALLDAIVGGQIMDGESTLRLDDQKQIEDRQSAVS